MEIWKKEGKLQRKQEHKRTRIDVLSIFTYEITGDTNLGSISTDPCRPCLVLAPDPENARREPNSHRPNFLTLKSRTNKAYTLKLGATGQKSGFRPATYKQPDRRSQEVLST